MKWRGYSSAFYLVASGMATGPLLEHGLQSKRGVYLALAISMAAFMLELKRQVDE